MRWLIAHALLNRDPDAAPEAPAVALQLPEATRDAVVTSWLGGPAGSDRQALVLVRSDAPDIGEYTEDVTDRIADPLERRALAVEFGLPVDFDPDAIAAAHAEP